jgi:site-specific DNA recombinase
MKRAAIYARFSTGHQNEKSIEDQIRLCEQHCSRIGYKIVETFKDEARSGTSIFGRDGLERMITQAKMRSFDVVVVESLDRLSRDSGDLPAMHRQFDFLDIEIESVHNGKADSIDVAVAGIYNSMFMGNVRKQVQRGMAGLVERGGHPGGRAYGYAAVQGTPGALSIIEREADIVRRIFKSYLEGKTPREIAKELNFEKVPAPRGDFWRASTINGNRQRKNGILQNPLYAGQIVWNRVRMKKDPATGRRISRRNPEDEWLTTQVPGLRIVDQETFDAVQKQKAERGGSRPHQRRKPRHLLSGLLKCGHCGAGMSVKDNDHGRFRIVCTQAKEAGSCTNRRPYYLDHVERTVLAGLKKELINPEAITQYVHSYNAEMKRLSASASTDLRTMQTRLAAINCEIQRALDAVMQHVFDADDVKDKVAALKQEREKLHQEIARSQSATPIVLHPTAITSYLESVSQLETVIRANSLAGSERSRTALRELVDAVIVCPPEEGRTGAKIEVRGYLARLVGGDLFPQRSYQGGKVVAEEGLEPPTRGL